MEEKVTIKVNEKVVELPLVQGTEDEVGMDITALRGKTGVITLDYGFPNTGSCKSSVTFTDGEKGMLRYRGYPIEQLAEKSNYLETAWLLIYGELPDAKTLKDVEERVSRNAEVTPYMKNVIGALPEDTHPMAIMSVGVSSLSCIFYGKMASNERQQDIAYYEKAVFEVLLARLPTIAAMAYRHQHGFEFVDPKEGLSYTENFLHMMFDGTDCEVVRNAEVFKLAAKALDVVFLLHADHEQNCSTSTVRTIASAGTNLFGAVDGGLNALWGPLHGGANMAVIEMLEDISRSEKGVKESVDEYIRRAEDKEDPAKLMGFGHRVYRNFDPRGQIIKDVADGLLKALGIEHDPLLEIAKELEQRALEEKYFKERKLYPNLDFYSGTILRAIGLPANMFTVMFALGRAAGWAAHWLECVQDPKTKITRPRQIYSGKTTRDYVSVEERG